MGPTGTKPVRQLRHRCGAVFSPIVEHPRYCPDCKARIRYPLDFQLGRIEEFVGPRSYGPMLAFASA